MTRNKIAATLALMIASAVVSGAANASLVVSDLGTVSPTAPDVVIGAGVSSYSSTANIITGGDSGSNWNPYGSGATSYHWLGLGYNNNGDSATFTFTAPETTFSLLWGSPSASNQIQLYSGANGTGTLLGTVTPDNLSQFSNTGNIQGAGAIISITSSAAFKSAVLTTAAGYGGFEVAQISAVPLPGALPLFGIAAATLAGLRLRRKKSV